MLTSAKKCPECTLFGKNIKTSAIYNSAKPLPPSSAPNQELQLDFSGPLIDDKKGKINILVAIDRFSKFLLVILTKTTSAKKKSNFYDRIFVIMVYWKALGQITDLGSTLRLLKNFAKVEA